MEKHDMNITKYPKSKRNFQCLGKCYFQGTTIVHPHNLELVVDHSQPFCPVDEWEYEDPETGKKTQMITDACFNPTDKENMSGRELQLDILTPYIDFNAEHFLKIYYNIFSFEDAIEWIDKNKFDPVATRARVMNAALVQFGESVDLFDLRFAEFFAEYIKKNFLKNIYDEIHMFIGFHNKSIMIINKDSNRLDKSDKIIERMNYIVKIFLDKDELSKFLSRYFKHRKSAWKETKNHLVNMGNDFVIYVTNKIGATKKIFVNL